MADHLPTTYQPLFNSAACSILPSCNGPHAPLIVVNSPVMKVNLKQTWVHKRVWPGNIATTPKVVQTREGQLAKVTFHINL